MCQHGFLSCRPPVVLSPWAARVVSVGASRCCQSWRTSHLPVSRTATPEHRSDMSLLREVLGAAWRVDVVRPANGVRLASRRKWPDSGGDVRRAVGRERSRTAGAMSVARRSRARFSRIGYARRCPAVEYGRVLRRYSAHGYQSRYFELTPTLLANALRPFRER